MPICRCEGIIEVLIMQESGMRLAERIMPFVLEFTCVHGEGGFDGWGRWQRVAKGRRSERAVHPR
jgi:hypothetical protein